jgi:RHS repeat-associated protein
LHYSLAATYRYDPFGNTISSSGPLAAANVYRFSSKECHVNSGVYYYLYRFYDPNLQRWLNADPKDETGFNVQSKRIAGEPGGTPNLYTFVHNRAANTVDSFGLVTYITKKHDCDDVERAACRSTCRETGMKDCKVIELWIIVPGVDPPDNEEYIGKQINCSCYPRNPNNSPRWTFQCH